MSQRQTIQVLIDGQQVAAIFSVDVTECVTLGEKLNVFGHELDQLHNKYFPILPTGWIYTQETRPAKEDEFRAAFLGAQVFPASGPCNLDCRIIAIAHGVPREVQLEMIKRATKNRELIKANQPCE